MKVKMYDAKNNVKKDIRKATSVAFYKGDLHIKDNYDQEFTIQIEEMKHHVIYICDGVVANTITKQAQ